MAKKKMDGICALCRVYGPLCESHIIPKFLYEYCYDYKNRSLHIPTDQNGTTRIIQDGHKEYLLCTKCEGILNKHETYMAELIRQIRSDLTPSSERYFLLNNFNYKAIKLFGISVLWRCSVSSLKIYADISLGTLHQERMREMLLNGDPGAPLEYGMVISKFYGSEVTERTIIPPSPGRFEGTRIYSMVAMSIQWVIKVSSHPSTGAIREAYVGIHKDLPIFLADVDEPRLASRLWKHIPAKNRERADRLAGKLKTSN